MGVHPAGSSRLLVAAVARGEINRLAGLHCGGLLLGHPLHSFAPRHGVLFDFLVPLGVGLNRSTRNSCPEMDVCKAGAKGGNTRKCQDWKPKAFPMTDSQLHRGPILSLYPTM